MLQRFTKSSLWILPILSLRIGRTRNVPDSSNHSLFLIKMLSSNPEGKLWISPIFSIIERSALARCNVLIIRSKKRHSTDDLFSDIRAISFLLFLLSIFLWRRKERDHDTRTKTTTTTTCRQHHTTPNHTTTQRRAADDITRHHTTNKKTHTHMYVHVFVYVCVSVRVCLCAYVYVYMYISQKLQPFNC